MLSELNAYSKWEEYGKIPRGKGILPNIIHFSLGIMPAFQPSFNMCIIHQHLAHKQLLHFVLILLI